MVDRQLHIQLTPNEIVTGHPVSFEVRIVESYGDQEPEIECPELDATITGEGKLLLRQTELIEPNEWPETVAKMMEAVEQARSFIDADWSLEGPVPDYKAHLSASIKAASQTEEEEPKALRIDYRVMDGDREVQTGMVDWQNGLYIWDTVEPLELWEFPAVADVIYRVTQKCKELMVDHRCWS